MVKKLIMVLLATIITYGVGATLDKTCNNLSATSPDLKAKGCSSKNRCRVLNDADGPKCQDNIDANKGDSKHVNPPTHDVEQYVEQYEPENVNTACDDLCHVKSNLVENIWYLNLDLQNKCLMIRCPANESKILTKKIKCNIKRFLRGCKTDFTKDYPLTLITGNELRNKHPSLTPGCKLIAFPSYLNNCNFSKGKCKIEGYIGSDHGYTDCE